MYINNIGDKYIIKDGKKIKKVQLLYIDSLEKLCDGCDEKKVCASVIAITGDIMIICKDCLSDIVNSFRTTNYSKEDAIGYMEDRDIFIEDDLCFEENYKKWFEKIDEDIYILLT